MSYAEYGLMPTYPAQRATSAADGPTGPKTHAYLALIGGILCIGFSAIFVKLAASTGDVVAFFRLGIATLVMTLPAMVNWRRGKARLPHRALWLGLLGGLTFAADAGLWNTALTMGTAANITLLGNTSPIWVGLGAWLLFRERLRPIYWLGVAIALGGATLIVGWDVLQGAGINLGNVLGMLAGIIYAAYQLITQRARQQIDNLTYTWVFSGTGAIILLIVCLALKHPLTGLPVRSYLAMLGLGLITHTGGWLLINYAFGYLRASLVSVTLLGQPIVTTLVALPILGEAPSWWHVLGGIITLAGIYVVHRSINSV